MPERVSPNAGMSDETLEHHLIRYSFGCKYVKDKVVLSVACGNGYGEYMFATEGGAKQVIGYDVSEEAVEFAKENYKAQNLEYIVGDVLNLDMPDNFVDVVVSFETIEHIEDDKVYLRELKRVLKPGGIVLISTPNKAKSLKNYFSKKPCNIYHVREYFKNEYVRLLREYFDIIEFLGQKIIIKRRWYTIPLYFLYKLTGTLKDVEIRDYSIRPYPTDLRFETVVFIAVCKKI